MQFLFILGRKTDLCFAEVQRVLATSYPQAELLRLLDGVALVDGIDEEQAIKLQNLLGGTMKIAKVSKIQAIVDTEAIEEITAEVLLSLTEEGNTHITFGVSELGRESLDALNLTHIKKLLKAKDISARFIDSPRFGLSASVLLHQDTEEVVVVKAQDKLFFGYTIAVQNIDEWTVRDREKPRADKKRGMLPPKLARIMVNLATGGEAKRILDPFCGTGTVLLEGLMVGCDVVGTDIRQEAVYQTEDNVKWLRERFNVTGESLVRLVDATQLSPEAIDGKVDAIVAEGLLGPLTPKDSELPNIYKGLNKLYKGVFKQWTQILNPGAIICVALPRVESKHPYSLATLIDSTSDFGYNTLSSPLIYDRPDAVVKREIFILQYQGK